MVTDDQKIKDWLPHPILEAIDVRNGTRPRTWTSQVTEEHRLGIGWEVPNELLALISPFLPVKGCTEVHIPMGLIMGNQPSAFHFWNGRYRLVMDLKEGWEPLCKFLDLPVPDGPLPRANDTAAANKRAEEITHQLMAVWAGVVGVAGVAVFGAWKVWRANR